MKCPVCRNELELCNFTIGRDNCVNRYSCEHCECEYENRPDGNKRAWWKCTKLPAYKLYEIEELDSGIVVNEYPLDEFSNQSDRFSAMSSNYMDGEQYILVIAREDEIDEGGYPTFDIDERTLCCQGDCGPRFHLEAAKNVKRWQDILSM